MSTAYQIVGLLLEDEFDAKDDLMAAKPSWAEVARRELEERDHVPYKFARAEEESGETSKVFLVDAFTGSTAYLVYRNPEVMRPDVFETVYDLLADRPSFFADDFLLRFFDFSRLRALLRMDGHIPNTETDQQITDYFTDMFGDQAVEQMLDRVPLSDDKMVAAAHEISHVEPRQLAYFISDHKGSIALSNGAEAIRYYHLPKAIKDSVLRTG